jgi:integrase
MQSSDALFDPKIEEFLEGKNPGTRSIYRAGLLAFQEFYQGQGTIPDFLDKLEADRNLGWRQKKGVASTVIRGYVDWLQTEKKFKRKTVRVYVAAIQQLAKKCDVPFQTNDVHLPASNPVLKKYAWTIDDVVKYLSFFESPMYRSMGVLIFQSFMDSSTALSLQYGDIQKEYEAGIVPLCLDTERVKSDIPFMTFIGKWGVKELHKWLDSRDDLSPETPLFPTSKVPVCDYFRKKAEFFLSAKFTKGERSPCGTHSLRAGGSTLARDSITGNSERVRAVDRYLDFFMGKTVEEQKRVYSSKSKEGWRLTWQTCVEPYVTPDSY